MSENKDYIKFLEESGPEYKGVSQEDFGHDFPQEPVVKYMGSGNLPETFQHGELDAIVKKILGTDPGHYAKPVTVKEEEDKQIEDRSPLSVLEEVEDFESDSETPEVSSEDIPEELRLSEQESEIISRLINEMTDMEEDITSVSAEDEFDDFESFTESELLGEDDLEDLDMDIEEE